MKASPPKPMLYPAKIKKLYKGIHEDVKELLDPKKQKRKFPKKALQNFLKKKKITDLIDAQLPAELTALIESTEKLDLVPSDILRAFFDEQEIWDLVPENIKKAIDGNQDPRAPTQGSSDFIINRELGDWAESVVLNGINKSDLSLSAVRYGRTDNLIAGENGFEELFLEHHTELKELGKRPDLLIYRVKDTPTESFKDKKANDLIEFAKKAIAGFEVRSSQQAINTDDRAEKLSFTPKIEDIHNVVRWINTHGVPHYYVQVLFGRVYAISFEKILEVLASPPKAGKYRIARVARNQFKSTIYIPLNQGDCISSQFKSPTKLKATIKELPTGRVVVVVKFSNGNIVLNKTALAKLLNLGASAS